MEFIQKAEQNKAQANPKKKKRNKKKKKQGDDSEAPLTNRDIS